MQHSGVAAPYRHRSPNLSDTEDTSDALGHIDAASTSSSASSSAATTVVNLGSSTGSGSGTHSSHAHSHSTPNGHAPQRAQRPRLAAHGHTQSGSFIRIKRKNTSTPNASATPTEQQQQAASGHAEKTVEQLASKTCFICYGDSAEDSPPSTSAGTAGGSSGNNRQQTTRPTRRWIHPCKCSLVAHEDCLLHWVQVSKPTATQTAPASCPQCNEPYTMHQVDYPVLNFIERIEAVWAKNVSKLLMVGVGVGSWTLLGIYGMWSIRQFAGPQVAEQLFLRKSTRWLTAPLVLPVIVLSRTHLLDSILPALPLTLILNSTLPGAYGYYAIQPNLVTDLQLSYPPNPALTLCIVPWVRAIYMALRRRLFRNLLGRSPTPLASPGTPGGIANGHVVGGQGGAQLPGEADFIQNHQRNHEAEPGLRAMFNEPENVGERRIVITVSRGARILAGSLVFPWAAASVGSLLLWLASRPTASGSRLAKILGVGVGLASTSASSASDTANTILSLANRFLPPVHVREYVDPVWWRNAIGGALLILAKDIWSLTRQIMEQKRAYSRRIESQPFRDGLDV